MYVPGRRYVTLDAFANECTAWLLFIFNESGSDVLGAIGTVGLYSTSSTTQQQQR